MNTYNHRLLFLAFKFRKKRLITNSTPEPKSMFESFKQVSDIQNFLLNNVVRHSMLFFICLFGGLRTFLMSIN